MEYIILLPANSLRPYRLARSRTLPFHGGNRGSNPLGDAIHNCILSASNQLKGLAAPFIWNSTACAIPSAFTVNLLGNSLSRSFRIRGIFSALLNMSWLRRWNFFSTQSSVTPIDLSGDCIARPISAFSILNSASFWPILVRIESDRSPSCARLSRFSICFSTVRFSFWSCPTSLVASAKELLMISLSAIA